ncbi:MAG: site-2 protease family protein [Pseudomonadota bacterium]
MDHLVPSLRLLLLWFVPFIFSLSFHEAAHAWTANRYGDPTARYVGRMTLNPLAHIDWIGTVLFPLVAFFTNFPLIGWARPVPVNERNLKRPIHGVLVAAAGPISNLILAILFTVALAIFYRLPGAEGGPISLVREPLVKMVAAGIQLNLILAVFNLIPFPPLDGGRILFGLFPSLSPRLAFAERYGFIIPLALFMTGVVNRVVFYPTQLVYYFLLKMAV